MYKKLLLIFLFSAITFFIGCGERDKIDQEIISDTLTTQPSAIDTAVDKTTAEKQDSIINLTGTYTGTFDQRPTTLKITEQNGKEFKGVITINYREVINQTVSGEVNTETNSFTMKDLSHSRFMGTYKGKISNGGEKLSGTFIMNLDKSNFNFSLTKK